MNRINWAAEPDVQRLGLLKDMLAVAPERAVAGLEALAGEGSAMGAYYLADHHLRTSQPDPAAALHWFGVSRALGSPQAAHMAGRLHLKQGDEAAAFRDFEFGARKGYLPAVYQLANMHRDGIGTPRDLQACIGLLRQAEAGGHLYARRDLAGLMVAGRLGAGSIASGGFMLARLWVDLVRAPFRKDGSWDERVIA